MGKKKKEKGYSDQENYKSIVVVGLNDEAAGSTISQPRDLRQVP